MVKHNRFLGFTLMELLIVISIIGILIAVATASYTSAQKKARDSRRQSDLKAIQNAFEQYYADNSAAYPASFADLTPTYLPNGEPLDPKGASYIRAAWTTAGFRICADLEGDGDWSALDLGDAPSGNRETCITNLQ